MNFMESLFSVEFIRAFAWTLLHSIWQGGLIGLLAVGFLAIFKKYGPQLSYWVLNFLLMLMPVLFALTFYSIYAPAGLHNADSTSIISNNITGENPVAGASVTNMYESWYASPLKTIDRVADLLFMIWFIGFLFFFIRFSGSLVYVHRLKHKHLYKVGEQWHGILEKLADKIRLKKSVRLAESAMTRIPITIGFLKPVILLPVGTLSGVPPQQIEAILLHELSHIFRKDYLLNIAQSLIELFFFYHPVTWWLSGLIRQEREHICDDMVVAVNKDYLNYIKALTIMEEKNSKSPLLASAMTGTKKKLLYRINRLVKPAHLQKGPLDGILAFVLLFSLVLTLSFNALSVIPSTYDLTGRESGDKLYNILPPQNTTQKEVVTQAAMAFPRLGQPPLPAGPDTITATSKSGHVTINVYTDSVSNFDQEALDRIVEDMDAKAKHFSNGEREYRMEWQSGQDRDDRDRMERQRRIIAISRSDSLNSDNDSLIVIYDDDDQPIRHFEKRYEIRTGPHGDVIVSHDPKSRYFYSHPDMAMPDFKYCKPKVYILKNDSLDSLMFIGKDSDWFKLPEDFKWSSEDLQKQLHDMQKNMNDFDWSSDEFQKQIQEFQQSTEEYQKQLQEIQKEYWESMPEKRSKDYFYYSEPPLPPKRPFYGTDQGHKIIPDEKIIRQELREDGLIQPDKQYVIEIDAKSMFINGEKQPKEVYQKYSKLVQGLGLMELNGDGQYKLIF